MTIKRLKPMLLLLFPVILCSYARAQEILTRTQLNDIYRQMYLNGNENFVFVKALRDGLIEPGKTSSFMYSAGKVMINWKELQEPFLTEYSLLTKAFLASQGNNGLGLLQMEDVKISANDVLDSASHFRKHKNIFATGDKVLNSDFVVINNPPPAPIQEVTTTNTGNTKTVTAYTQVDPICNELVKDGLADPAKGYSLLYNSGGIYVNDTRMDNASEAKYRQLFKKDLHFEADSPLASYKITRTAKKNPANDEKTDINVSAPGKN
ncbi:hypothetical protein ACTHGU_12635 [Chitinophagaceae bacterium MMS25-I14]